MQYLPITGDGFERSRSEAMARGAGLRPGDVSRFWHGVLTHPVTGQHALAVEGLADKEYFTQFEIECLLSQEEAEEQDWFLDFEED